MLGKAVAKDGAQICYIAPTYIEARDILWEPLKKMSKGLWVEKPNETRLELRLSTQDGGTAIIYLKGWESVESLRGMQFDFLVLDEVAKFRNFWELWHEVLRATLGPRKGDALFLSTPRGYNHFFDLYHAEDENQNYKSFHFTSYDNPHMDREELEAARDELSDDQFAQEYLADFRKQEGLVYKDFDRKRHLFDTQKPNGEIVLGIDFGFTNPACILEIVKDHDGTYWVMSEWYKSGKTEKEIAEVAASHTPNYVYADPQSPSAINELTKANMPIFEVRKGADSVVSGIDKVRTLLWNNQLRIHKDCINLIQEFETYHYAEARDGKKGENPVKENDHALDALRYVVMMNVHSSSSDESSSEEFKLYSYAYD